MQPTQLRLLIPRWWLRCVKIQWDRDMKSCRPHVLLEVPLAGDCDCPGMNTVWVAANGNVDPPVDWMNEPVGFLVWPAVTVVVEVGFPAVLDREAGSRLELAWGTVTSTLSTSMKSPLTIVTISTCCSVPSNPAWDQTRLERYSGSEGRRVSTIVERPSSVTFMIPP